MNIGNDSEKMHKMIIGRFDYQFAVAERNIVAEDQGTRDHLTTVEIADAPGRNMRYLLCSKGNRQRHNEENRQRRSERSKQATNMSA